MTSPINPSAPPPLTETHLLDVLRIVHNHLLHQAYWHSLAVHDSPELPRPLIAGIPPEGTSKEWVLPVNLREKWSLRKWAEVFDALPEEVETEEAGGRRGNKRLTMGVVSDDSTVVYYVVRDGIVKPKQN
jgi:tRNA-splicing endonuclease subunit Sen15